MKPVEVFCIFLITCLLFSTFGLFHYKEKLNECYNNPGAAEINICDESECFNVGVYKVNRGYTEINISKFGMEYVVYGFEIGSLSANNKSEANR